MSKQYIVELFDNEKYSEVISLTNPYNKTEFKDYEILYYLKAILVLDDFKIKNKDEIKKLLFYYFYLSWKVEFENNYIFYFKGNLYLNFLNLERDISELSDFKQYFDLWKNEIFLNKIIDKSIKQDKNNFREWAVEIDNIIDFFMNFTHECSELYAFSWENFPLFKWLINELIDYE